MKPGREGLLVKDSVEVLLLQVGGKTRKQCMLNSGSYAMLNAQCNRIGNCNAQRETKMEGA